MPYKRSGNRVMHKKSGKWVVKQVWSSPSTAQKAINLLQGVVHGWSPTGEKVEVKTGERIHRQDRRSL